MSIERLKEMLEDSGGDDYWSDVLAPQAQALARTLDEEGWLSLKSDWEGWPNLVRARLAHTLRRVRNSHAAGMLAELAYDRDQQTAQIAASSLLFQDPPASEPAKQKLIARIEEMCARADDFDARALDRTLVVLKSAPPSIE